jgi:molybdate transport system substrate-binding protein
MRRTSLRRLMTAVLCLAAFGVSAGRAPAAPAPQPLTVLAAASMHDALDAAIVQWNKTSNVAVRVSYAATSALARQIEQSAPADVFISADQQWMDKVQKEGLIDVGSRQNLVGNSLVMVAGPGWTKGKVTLNKDTDLDALVGKGGHLAMALVNSVPAGIYGKEALTSLGLWSKAEPSVVQAENVRVALAYVARGEAALGIVYSTDAVVEPKVKIVGTFPASSHKPIVYPLAVLKSSQNPAAAKFAKFLLGKAAWQVFDHYGFVKPSVALGS